jgi:hypothetical protein
MDTLVTKREWLAERGLAQAGMRGRFSKEANAALEQAIADGVVFADDQPRTAQQNTGPSLAYDAKKVRRWAAAQGITVGERGRIPAEIVAQYHAATSNGEVESTEPVASPEAVVASIPQERVRDEDVAYVHAARGENDPEYISEPVVGFSECDRCKRLVAFCPCEGGPVAPAYLTNGEPVSGTLTLPE